MDDYYMLAQDRIQEALREAECERLVRQAEMPLAGQPWYAGPLAALGTWLAARGTELQVRFGQPKPTIWLGEVSGRMAAP